MFALALGKTNSDKAEEVLIVLLEDDQVKLHAIEALGKIGSQKAKGSK